MRTFVSFITWSILFCPRYRSGTCANYFSTGASVKMTWSDAQAYCQAEYGSVLAIVDTANKLPEAAAACSIFSSGSDDDCWIGLERHTTGACSNFGDHKIPASYQWADGTAVTSSNFAFDTTWSSVSGFGTPPWNSGEPNDCLWANGACSPTESGNEKCIAMEPGSGNRWKDVQCCAEKYFICNAATSPPTTSPSGSPSKAPSASPSKSPSESPSKAPSKAPTDEPSDAPTTAPTPCPNHELDEKKKELNDQNNALDAKNNELNEKIHELDAKNQELVAKNNEFATKNNELDAKNNAQNQEVQHLQFVLEACHDACSQSYLCRLTMRIVRGFTEHFTKGLRRRLSSNFESVIVHEILVNVWKEGDRELVSVPIPFCGNVGHADEDELIKMFKHIVHVQTSVDDIEIEKKTETHKFKECKHHKVRMVTIRQKPKNSYKDMMIKIIASVCCSVSVAVVVKFFIVR